MGRRLEAFTLIRLARFQEAYPLLLASPKDFYSELGDYALYGLMGERDLQKAALFYRKGVAPRNSFDSPTGIASMKLSTCYAYGIGVEKDEAKARFYAYLALKNTKSRITDAPNPITCPCPKQLEAELNALLMGGEPQARSNSVYDRLQFQKMVRGLFPGGGAHDFEQYFLEEACRFKVALAERLDDDSFFADLAKERLRNLKGKGYLDLPSMEKENVDFTLPENTIISFPGLSVEYSRSKEAFLEAVKVILTLPLYYLRDERFALEESQKQYLLEIEESLAKPFYERLILIDYPRFHDEKMEETLGIDSEALILNDLEAPLGFPL